MIVCMLSLLSLVATGVLGPSAALAQSTKPNILVIWGDDIGIWNISHNSRGMMGYYTPNIDRIAREGVGFTDYYGQQSCTAGRAAFMGGTVPVRTGMTKVGLPGAQEGWQKSDPTIAVLLKAQGYATGQFGKNHFGDRDQHLPTAHGFDEYFGSLYHLNASEEPENLDYPKDPEFLKKFGPRGVIRAKAGGTIEDTGPLTKQRMETIDDETSTAALDFIDRQVNASTPFFAWWNGTRMHFRTHVKAENRGKSGQDEYSDGMVEHDVHVGQLLKKLDDPGVAAQGVLVCQRRRPDRGRPLSGLEGRLPRESRRSVRRLAQALRRAARAAAVQPAPRPAREGPAQLEHLQRLVPGSAVRDRPDPGSGRPVPADHEGLSPEPDPRLVQSEQDRGATEGQRRTLVRTSGRRVVVEEPSGSITMNHRLQPTRWRTAAGGAFRMAIRWHGTR